MFAIILLCEILIFLHRLSDFNSFIIFFLYWFISFFYVSRDSWSLIVLFHFYLPISAVNSMFYRLKFCIDNMHQWSLYNASTKCCFIASIYHIHTRFSLSSSCNIIPISSLVFSTIFVRQEFFARESLAIVSTSGSSVDSTWRKYKFCALFRHKFSFLKNNWSAFDVNFFRFSVNICLNFKSLFYANLARSNLRFISFILKILLKQ